MRYVCYIKFYGKTDDYSAILRRVKYGMEKTELDYYTLLRKVKDPKI